MSSHEAPRVAREAQSNALRSLREGQNGSRCLVRFLAGESYGRALQLYLTVITAAVGAVFLLMQGQAQLPRFGILLLGSVVLLIGEVTYLRIIGLDISLMEAARAHQLLRERFVQIEPDLAQVFLRGLVYDEKRYERWSSIRGVLRRALTVSQEKTVVVSLNCLVFASLVWVGFSFKTIWVGLGVALLTSLFVGLLHACYASWRYRGAQAAISMGKVGHWI